MAKSLKENDNISSSMSLAQPSNLNYSVKGALY